jgi:transcriptional regulator with XRE-family HTH domain
MIVTKAEQATIVKTIGARMKAARELCNMSQKDAARRLGYANSSKLAKVELATDYNSVPLWLIQRAAKLYEVSIDYLFGASDDWEIGARKTQEREVSGWLYVMFNRARSRDTETLRQLNDKIETIEQAVTWLVGAAGEVAGGLERFGEINPQFEDMRGGSRLYGAVLRLTAAAENAKARLARFHIECRLAVGDTRQLSLTI